MDSEKLLDEYIDRMCRTGKYTKEEAKNFAMVKCVEKYYKEICKDEKSEIGIRKP